MLAELFAVLEPAALSATAQALAEADAHFRQRLAAFELAVERARFEADRARRQFDAVEPENRLVARTLEKALEDKLAAQRRAENDLAAQRARRPVALSDAELAWIARAGADVRAIFDAPTTTTVERKQLLRAVIAEIVLTVDTGARIAALRIIWQGGATTELSMPMTKTGGHTRATDEDTIDLVRRLAADYDDRTIAADPGQAAAGAPRSGLHWTKSPRRGAADLPRHPRPPTATDADCRSRRPGWRRGHHQRRGEDPARLQGHPLPVAARRVPRRRATHPRRALAHPHRPAAPGPDPARGPDGWLPLDEAASRPRRGPADGVAQGPTRRTRRRLRQPRPPQRAAYPGQTDQAGLFDTT